MAAKATIYTYEFFDLKQMLRLSKTDKLCSRTKIENLFAQGQSFIQYPIRVVYRIHPQTTPEETHQFFISVPKRKFKKAVKRVWLRRRIREAYRLHKHILPTIEGFAIDIAFLYLSSEKSEFAIIERRMIEILNKLSNHIQSSQNKPNTNGRQS